MIERIKLWLTDDAEYKGIDPAELKELAEYFHDAMTKALGDACCYTRAVRTAWRIQIRRNNDEIDNSMCGRSRLRGHARW